MANPYSEATNHLVFQSLYFMEMVYDVLEDEADDDEDKLDHYWGVETDVDEGGPAAFAVIDLRRKGNKDSSLDLTRWFALPGCESPLPLYINVLRDDEEEVWEDLKAEFKEATVFEDDTRLGLEWTLAADATRDQIRDAGRTFGRRLAKAIWGN